MNELDLFIAANAISDAAERAAYLDQVCADQPQLRQRLEALLAGNAQSRHPLDEPPSHPPAPADHTRNSGDHAGTELFQAALSPEEAVGTVIAGRYKLRQLIGEGGMGTVWMADQTEPVKRKVAVKLIRVDRGQSKTILARFEAERQAIALMDHPHIARLLDAGTTDNGSPFFVMELVKGIPLNEFCDQHRLTFHDRLGLFTQICSAVQHAHQKGIIHRDLKPSNILVESHDGKPVPKVIDFGLAKATTGLQLTEQSLFTAFGNVMGTPLYMAPEQASFNALDVDTRADVYALGVILYELLTGTTPITRDTLKKAALDELLKLIREQEAPTPSSRLSTAESAPSVAANRQIEPVKLGRFVKGELDWIVLKALSKDRNRRYETANGFARDIERFLAHEPVQAGPPSASYRVKKFVQRNRGQVIAASLVLLALVAGMAGTTLGLIEAKRQERLAVAAADEERKAKHEAELQQQRAETNEKLASERLALVEAEKKNVEAEKKRADEEKQIAQAVKEFLQNKLLAQADTRFQVDALLKAGGNLAEAKPNPTVRELLDRAAKELAPDKIEANFPKQPLVQAEILRTVGVAYNDIGEPGTGINFLKRAETLHRQHLGTDNPVTLESMNILANVYVGVGQWNTALPLQEDTYKLRKVRLGPDHLDTIKSMSDLALTYGISVQHDKALPLFEEALKLLTKANLDPARPEILGSMGRLGLAYLEARQLDKALPLLEETHKLTKEKLGPDHPSTHDSMGNLAYGYMEAKQLDKALPLMEETLRLKKAMFGPDHPSVLGCMNNLAVCYSRLKQLDKSVPLLEELLPLYEKKFGRTQPDTQLILGNLGANYKDAGRAVEAIPLLEEVYNSSKKHPALRGVSRPLADAYAMAGQHDKAQSLLEEALELSKADLGPDHHDTLGGMANLATGYWNLKRLDKSVPLFEELLPLFEKKLGRDHQDTQTTVANLGVNYKGAGRLKEAIPLLEEAYRASKKFPNVRFAGPQLFDAYAQAGQRGKAAKLIDELLPDARKTSPKDSPELAGMMAHFGMSLLKMKGYAEAEPLLRECLAIREEKEPNDWRTFNTLSMLGQALLGQKKYPDAEPLLLQGYEGMKARQETIPPPAAAARIPEALDRLIELYTATNKPDEAQKYRELRAEYSPELTP